MTVRTRFIIWFTGILFLAVLLMGLLSYYELVIEPHAQSFAPGADLRDHPLSEISEFLAWCGVVPLVLALAGAWWVIRKALQPIDALTQAAELLNEHNLNRRLPRSGNGDEIDRLTEVFNSMTERLHQSFVRIHEFTLYASHELKTPLTILHAELETALQDPTLNAALRQGLESQLDEIQRLTKIVDGLSLLTKADAGQVPLARQVLPLDDLVREAHADAQSLARPEGISVRLEQCDPVMVLGDRHRLRQLLLNLCDNAIKYNCPRGYVTLNLRRSGQTVALSVANTGPGIPPEILPRIFEPFFRGDPSHSSVVEGCGLGLSIARWIVQAHGGSIRITSNPSQPTTITAQLPITTKVVEPEASKRNLSSANTLIFTAKTSDPRVLSHNGSGNPQASTEGC